VLAKPFAVELWFRPRSAPDEEPFGSHVSGRPIESPTPLEPEHAVVDVERIMFTP